MKTNTGEGGGILELTYDEALGYYWLTLTSGIETLEEVDYSTIARLKLYTSLPFTITKIIFESLTVYRSISKGTHYQGYKYAKTIDVNIRDKETGYFQRLDIDINPESGLANMGQESYVHFFTHYVQTVNAYYYEMELTNSKAHTAPMQKYNAEVLYLYEVMVWYIGKATAKNCIKIYTDTFFTYLRKSKYKDIISVETMEGARKLAYYELFRE